MLIGGNAQTLLNGGPATKLWPANRANVGATRSRLHRRLVWANRLEDNKKQHFAERVHVRVGAQLVEKPSVSPSRTDECKVCCFCCFLVVASWPMPCGGLCAEWTEPPQFRIAAVTMCPPRNART